MEFKILGPLEVSHNGHLCTPRAPKVKQVLALLLLRANQVVSLDSFIEELWGEKSPQTAVTTTQTYIYHLRKALIRANDKNQTEEKIRTAAPGYILRAEEENLDIKRFDSFIARAQSSMAVGEFGRASQYASQALALWRGAPSPEWIAETYCAATRSTLRSGTSPRWNSGYGPRWSSATTAR